MPKQSKNPPHFNPLDEAKAEEWRQWYRKGGWKESRRCEWCHGFYYPRIRRQRWCSEKCGEKAKWERRKAKAAARKRASILAKRQWAEKVARASSGSSSDSDLPENCFDER